MGTQSVLTQETKLDVAFYAANALEVNGINHRLQRLHHRVVIEVEYDNTPKSVPLLLSAC